MRTLQTAIFSLCTLLAACNTYNSVTISVANASGDPVPGASAQASPMYFFNPTDNDYFIVGPYDIMEPFPAKGDAGISDEHGEVLLKIVTESPLELIVRADDYRPWKGQIVITKHGFVEIHRSTSDTELRVTSNE